MRTKQVVRRLGNHRKVKPMSASAIMVYTRVRCQAKIDCLTYRLPLTIDRELAAEAVGFAIQDRVIRELQTGVRS